MLRAYFCAAFLLCFLDIEKIAVHEHPRKSAGFFSGPEGVASNEPLLERERVTTID